jgi:hypothetical protein
VESPWLQYLYQALAEEHGIKLYASDVSYTINRLRVAREKVKDPALLKLRILRAPSAVDQVWIVKDGNEANRESHPQSVPG